VKGAIALVSARAARALDEDMAPLIGAFAAAGVRAEIADWDDDAVDWAAYDAALLRSAWDYTERLPQFLSWVERTASLTRLLNPPEVVRWNADKHYLLALAAAGLPIVPSTFAEPGAQEAQVLGEFLGEHACAELVVKPAVGAGSRDTRRHHSSARREILGHMRALLSGGRSLMLQPYLEAVDHHGETALIFIAGAFSHSIRKGPLLPPGAASTTQLFAAETINPRAPGAEELAVARRVLALLPFGELLYARVDLIPGPHGEPRLLELELAEPSLFLAHAPGSAERLARALLARLHGGF
jgi:glutathione synthase/RimK-type ligase-like ATP-grasp enzyme